MCHENESGTRIWRNVQKWLLKWNMGRISLKSYLNHELSHFWLILKEFELFLRNLMFCHENWIRNSHLTKYSEITFEIGIWAGDSLIKVPQTMSWIVFGLFDRNLTFSSKSDVFVMKVNPELGFDEMFKMALKWNIGRIHLISYINHWVEFVFRIIWRNFDFFYEIWCVMKMNRNSIWRNVQNGFWNGIWAVFT